jgi:hypothetical protein
MSGVTQKNMLYEFKVDTIGEQLQQIFNPAGHVNDTAVIHKVMLSTVERVRACIQDDGSHSEHLLN